MAKSSVLINLTSNPSDGESFIVFSNNTTDINITFKTTPLLIGECKIGIDLEGTLFNLFQYIDDFYNSLSEYTLTLPTSSSLKAESTVNNTVFTKDDAGLTNGTVVITNETVVVPVNILSSEFPLDVQPLSGCNVINVLIKTDIDIDEYSIDGAPRVSITPTKNAYITLNRESDISLEVFNTLQASEVSDTVALKTPLKLENLKNYITFTSQYFPSGSTLTVNLDPNPSYPYWENGNQYRYGFLGGTYQFSRVFTGLNSGLQHNFGYLEDSEGETICLKDDEFDGIVIPVTEAPTDVKTPYFEISESNSLTLEYVQEYNDYTRKNSFNSKSCQSNTQISETIIQEFDEDDKIPTQFRSNYETHVVKGITKDGSELELPVSLLYKNTQLKDSRDSLYYNLGNDKVGLYFTSGNTYEFDTTTIAGTYELNGFLPEWGIIGNYAFVYELGGWLEIVNIIFDDNKGADVLVFDYTYNGLEKPTRVSSIYNRELYDVYKFDTNMYNFKDNVFNIELKCTDTRDGWEDLTLSSENISVNGIEENYVEVIYFDYENDSDMQYYDTDFYNLLRLPYDLFYSGAESEKEVEKTDNTAITHSTRNYHIKTLSLQSVPEQYMRKITQAFSHKEIFIDRIQYTVDEVEVGEVVGNTNTYPIDIQLIAAENGFNPLLDRTFVGKIKINKTLSELFIEKVKKENGTVVSEKCIINYPF